MRQKTRRNNKPKGRNRNDTMRIRKTNKTLEKSQINKYLEKQRKTICEPGLKSFEKDWMEKKDVLEKKADIEKELIHLLHKKTVPDDILPNNDFYTYINYEWMKYVSKDLPKNQRYIVQIDNFRLTQDKVYKDLMDIVKNYIKHNDTEKARQIENVYESNIKLLSRDKMMYHIDWYVKYLDDCIKTDVKGENFWKYVGYMNRNEIISFGLPFVFGLYPDDKQADIYRCTINQPTLTCLDVNVYYDDYAVNDTEKKYVATYRRNFVKYVEDVFSFVFGKDHGVRGEDIFEIEKEIIDAMDCTKIEGYEKEKFYNRIYTSESKDKYDFDWNLFAKAYGFERTPSFFITNNVNYMKCGSELFLKNWKSPKWRNYFIFIYIRQIVRFNKIGIDVVFDFCCKFMRGQTERYDESLFPVYGLAFSFNTFLVNEYINKFADMRVIKYVKAMAEDLRIVFMRKIERNQWLLPKTKAYALKKLKKISMEIGSPTMLREDPIFNYSPDDCWANFKKIFDWRCKQFIALEGKKVIDIPIIDWSQYQFNFIGSQSYIVNAFYTPTKNGIYIPLAYLQKPFIDLEERGIEYNLAYIGYTIAHELCHSLDDLGSQYDANGNLHNWWSKQDKEIFKKKQKDVIRQYEEWALRDGIELDASSTIGEDLADIGGASLMMEYLKDFQDKNNNTIPIRLLSLKAFLVYFAIQGREKISNKRGLEIKIKTNPHPLEKYRVNVPLSRYEIFRDIYEVKKNDKMFWHNTDTIW